MLMVFLVGFVCHRMDAGDNSIQLGVFADKAIVFEDYGLYRADYVDREVVEQKKAVSMAIKDYIVKNEPFNDSIKRAVVALKKAKIEAGKRFDCAIDNSGVAKPNKVVDTIAWVKETDVYKWLAKNPRYACIGGGVVVAYWLLFSSSDK